MKRLTATLTLLIILTTCVYASASIPARPFSAERTTKNKNFHFPNVNPNHKHINMLLENSLSYIAPEHKMIEPISGYPLEGWNHDPEKGLYLRAFTQLTAIGEWLELMTNIATGYADNPYVSRQQALAQAARITKSLLADQNNPNIGAKGLLVNFLGLENSERLGPMARDIEKKTIIAEFGKERGEKLWNALTEKGWLRMQRQGTLGVIERGSKYGTHYFDGPLEPFSDKATVKKLMDLLDKRILQIVFGDNANLSASVAKSIGALMSGEVKNKLKFKKLRRNLEKFLDAQKDGYTYLYDKKTDTFIFGWNATDDRFYGWDDGKDGWITGHMNYIVSEFRGPELFVVIRFGLPEKAIQNCGFKMKPYSMQDGTSRHALAPWSGSAFQGLGLSLFMQEMNNPAWSKIMNNFVDIELDFANSHGLPGFLSESYTGIGTQYTGDVGIPALAVAEQPRIIDAPSLYTLGVAYSIAPDKIENFLAANWPTIEKLLTDHGPWEGYNTTKKQVIEFQTTAHTLSFTLGALATGEENMTRYLDSKGLMPKLAKLYKPGQTVNVTAPNTRIDAWSADGSAIETTLKDGVCSIKAPNGIKQGGAKFALANKNGVSFSNGTLSISYKSKSNIDKAVIKFVRSENSSTIPPSMPNELFINFIKASTDAKQIHIPLPATPSLSEIKAVELNFDNKKKSGPMDLTLTQFKFVPFENALNNKPKKS